MSTPTNAPATPAPVRSTGTQPPLPATRTLTLGIDARAAEEVPAGRGRLVRELLRALAAREDDGGWRYVLYARRAWREQPLDARFQWREIPARDPWWHARAARAADRECDVFLSTNSYLTGWLLHIPDVPIVYDLVPFEPALLPNRRSAVIERVTLGRSVRRAAALLAISQATARALTERFPATAARTVVAPLGVAPTLSKELDPAEAAELPPDGFVLAVGTLEPRKNLPRLVEAYRSLRPDLAEAHPLVVVGARGWQTGETLDALRSLGERCTMLGYVSDAALAELYRRCAVFCYPSLGEGFGLPVLEAMAAGAAVLTSNVSSLPEVGGDAVEYADPREVASIAAALERVLGDETHRTELGRRAQERARLFSWDAFAERVLEVVGEAAGR
ncbi:MAG TPA: glycosyltransferase family 1 protein [Solirubrobacteraceae bacterium]|jgi:glycosyltransferase involved in cell wall biosynthesis|nr:glycosyltransferase family 1 protein [Solirubrobacteraceae bacterium]